MTSVRSKLIFKFEFTLTNLLAIAALAFAVVAGLTFLVLACALPSYGSWWPMFVMVFYVLSPIPISISKAFSHGMSSNSALYELAVFLTTSIVLSAFALPLVFAHTEVIAVGSCVLTCLANIVIFGDIIYYFYICGNESSYTSPF
uniref:Leptin receptor gene-related protein n=1 Tax=Rhabditophanes sp. KR3021 TaxID=114890 RepID=A0AC35TZB0_9BILA